MSHTDGHGEVFDQEINVKGIVYTVVGLAGVTVLAFVLMAVMVRGMEGAERANDPAPRALSEANERWIPPGPRLQEYPPTTDIEAFRATEEATLNSFGWVDEDAGVIHIPLESAMEVLARRGLPTGGQVDAMSAELFGGVAPSQESR